MNNRKLGLGVIALSVLAIIGMGVLWAVYGWMPAQKANLAPVIDGPFYFVKWASAALTLGVVLAMLYLMVKYTRKSETQRSEVVIPNTIMETAWIVLPTILVLVVFTWGFKAYVTSNVAPPGAYEIYVKGKKWLWEFTYPNGVVTNELTVPANRPVKLIMTSDDVLHSFYIPEFRVKHDVIPNRYTSVWFESGQPTATAAQLETPGYDFVQVFCTEYCGTAHSAMGTRLNVLMQRDFDTWLASVETPSEASVDYGEKLYSQKACITCHSVDGSGKVGPTFKGIYGRQQQMTDGSVVESDEDYLYQSIVNPGGQVVAGYQNQMPVIALDEVQIQSLIMWMKTVE